LRAVGACPFFTLGDFHKIMSGRHAQALAFLIPDDSGLLAAAFALTLLSAARDDIFLPAQSGRQRLPHRMPFERALLRAFRKRYTRHLLTGCAQGSFGF
jgi:hypothetical protein